MILSFISYRWSKKHSIDKTQAVQGATGSTALHVACANGCIKIVDLLIRNNARIDVKDKYGSTPLDVAQAKHETEIVKLLKAARENQAHQKHRSMSCSNNENESRARKSIDSVVMTDKRTASDKQPRIRRPSLPSIFEGHNHIIPHNIPSFISMTPSLSSTTTTTNNSNLEPPNASSRRSFSAHRPLSKEMHTHSCPVTPRTSLEYFNNSKRSQNRNIPIRDRSPRSSEDSSAITYSTSPSQGSIFNSDYTSKAIITADGQQPDWYAFGVINHYDDDNYLLSLERRAYNLSSNEYGELERHSQESSRRPAIHDDMSTTHRRQSTASSDDQQSDSYLSAKGSDSYDFGNKLRTTALKNAMTAKSITSVNPTTDSISASSNNEEEGYEGEVDDEEDDDYDEEDEEEESYSSEPLPRPSIVLDSGPEADLVRYRFLQQDDIAATTGHEKARLQDQAHNAETKKGWLSSFGKEVGRHSLDSHSRKSLDFRPSFENFTQFAKRGVPNILGQDDNSSEDDERHQHHQQQQRNSFFSKWAPSWSKK